MKKLVRILLVNSALLASSWFTCSAATAESVGVDFNGVISPVTSIEITEQPVINIDSSGISNNTLEATTPAIVTIQTTAPVSATVSPPVPVGFSDPSGTQYTGFLKYNATEVTNGQILPINSTGSTNVEVSMKVVRPSAFPPGTYTYRVTVMFTAQ